MTTLVKSAFDKLKDIFDKNGRVYEIETRPYYSAAGVLFTTVDEFTIGGANRAWAVALKGQQLNLFAYGKGDNVGDLNLGNRNAQDHDTNQSTASRTNGEDFAIEGISATSRGMRVVYSAAVVNALANVTNPFVRAALGGGTTIQDPGSVVVPAEAGSPLILEDLFWEACKPKLTATTQWNRKAVDLIGVYDQFPEGGAKSYLRASGEPSHHDFFRIPQGEIWQHDGTAVDTLFSLKAELVDNVVIAITRAEGYQAGANLLGYPDGLVSEFKTRLVGRAFFEPSKN